MMFTKENKPLTDSARLTGLSGLTSRLSTTGLTLDHINGKILNIS